MRWLAMLSALVVWASLAGPGAAQGVGQTNQTNSEQKGAQSPAGQRHTGVALACAPSPNGRDYSCYREGEGEAPTFLGRAWRWIFRLGRDPIAVLTLLLFFIGGIQVWIADRTAKRQLRAYVFLDHTSLHDGSGADPPWPPDRIGIPTVINVVKNFGQTPAYDVIHWSAVDVKRVSEEHLLAAPNPFIRSSPAIFGPTNSSSRVRTFHRQLTPHELSEIATGVSAIFYFGRIEYRDVFRHTHSVDYRVKYVGVWPPAPNASMTYCDEGNAAD